MKKMLLSALILSGSLFADRFENCEYQLPEIAKDWTVTEIPSEDETFRMVMHTPSPSSSDQGFSLMSLPGTKPIDLDMGKLEELFREQEPKIDIKMTVLERDESSVLYKVHTQHKEEQKVLISCCRCIHSENKNILLSYQTTADSEIDPLWLKTLKDAKLCEF